MTGSKIKIEKPRCTSVYLPNELRHKLEAEAQRQKRSVSNLLVIILFKFFGEHSESGNARG